MSTTFNCPYCKKELDFMTIQMDKDLRFVFDVLPSFGTRYSTLVMGYACLFGVTPFQIKAKKLRLIMEEMKRLFDAQTFSYQKKKYEISHAGIAEALDLCIKKNFEQHLENHNYLKKVMLTISEREGKDKSKSAEKELRTRETHLVNRETERPSEAEAKENIQKVYAIIDGVGRKVK
jgi:hypothetical protein